MALTDEQLLTATREAIDALVQGGASSYTLNGRTVTKVDLPALRDTVEWLESRIARASGSGGGFSQIVARGL